MTTFNCDICGKECEFDYTPNEGDGFFVVCNNCNDTIDSGVWVEKNDPEQRHEKQCAPECAR